MKVKTSFFGSPNDVSMIAAAGYDCIEMQAVAITIQEEDDFQRTKESLKKMGLTCQVLDNPVPLDQCIADDSFDLNYYQDYLCGGAERAAQMGVRYYIFGNGKTRSLPMEGDIEKAKEKNLSFLRMLADITAEHGITVLIEPLAPQVSNVILSLQEALDYIALAGKPNLGTFLDYRWFQAQNRPISDIEKYGKDIKHVHIDCPLTEFPRRVIPRIDDGHDYSQFFQSLENIDYEGIISIEANTFADYEQDLREGKAFFKAFGIN